MVRNFDCALLWGRVQVYSNYQDHGESISFEFHLLAENLGLRTMIKVLTVVILIRLRPRV
jgi:hypothetical protein